VGFAGLGVIAEVPETKAMEASGRVKFRAACIALAVLGFSFIAGYLLSRSLTWPLKLLALAATRISAGDFKVSLLVKGNDEIAHLAKTVNHMAKDLESREKMMDMFNKFHNKEVVAKLMANEVKLGGERLNAVIFFSDIRDFTHVSGHMSPEQVVEMLNEYMAIMVRVIRKNGGIVDKFVGDAIMALWGVPERKSHDSFYAVKACLEMRTALAQLNKRRITAGKLPIVIGMGLNSGQVIAGNIGSNEKMEYTVIGDAVNMASRIEGATKTFGTDLLVPKHMRDELDGAYVFGPGETVSVKGKADSFEVFKVLGYYSESGKATLVETPYSKYESKGDDEKAKKPAAKSNVITPTVQTWWVKTSDRVSGPFTWDAILEFFRDGTMDERIQLSENPDGVFRPLRLTPELQEYIAFVKEERMKIGKAG
jgi:adenylate cyclase